MHPLESASNQTVQITTSEAPVNRPDASSVSTVAHDAALLLVPICFVAIWAGVVCVISDTWKLSRKDVKTSKAIAQLPCRKCRFFSNNPYIKCAVNPYVAMTKAATECQEYLPRTKR